MNIETALPNAAPQTAESGALERDLALEPAALSLWQRSSAISVAIPTLIGSSVLSIASILAALALLLGGTLLIGLLWRYWRRYAANFSCRLLADGLLVRRGVWWHSDIFIPRSRIQHTEVNQGPLARRYGLAELRVFTAGTHASKTEIDGLAHTAALRIRDELLGREGHDAV